MTHKRKDRGDVDAAVAILKAHKHKKKTLIELPDKFLVDTNVAVVANQPTRPPEPSERLSDECVETCINVIVQLIGDEKGRRLILDEGGEILEEYCKNLIKGQPGVGDRFLKWVLTQAPALPKDQLVPITKCKDSKGDDSYKEFPSHEGLVNFDRSDRKFIAVANAYSEKNKPKILEAADSKWWGWKDPLREVGIEVIFLCPEYVQKKYEDKFGTC